MLMISFHVSRVTVFILSFHPLRTCGLFLPRPFPAPKAWTGDALQAPFKHEARNVSCARVNTSDDGVFSLQPSSDYQVTRRISSIVRASFCFRRCHLHQLCRNPNLAMHACLRSHQETFRPAARLPRSCSSISHLLSL